MQELSILFEELLNENPNLAIKFLKEKNLDPETNVRGKKILDDILAITKGDGYTFLLTKFYFRDRLPLDEVQKFHEFLRSNKDFLRRLPLPVINYDSYGKLKSDIEHITGERSSKRLYNQLSVQLKQQVDLLSVKDKQLFKSLAIKFEQLTPERQRHFMKKIFGFKDVQILMQNINEYIKSVESGNDYESTKNKIIETADANLVYDNPDTEMLIAHINSFDSSKKLGCTSAWCITKDISRYREYKAGRNYYFFIWDYKYPIDDPNFFIATAYSESDPESSRTHEHTNDAPMRFSEVVESKKLNYNILNNYIKNFKTEYYKTINTRSPIFQALKNKNEEKLQLIIQKSAIFKEYGKSAPYSYRYSNDMFIGIPQQEFKEVLDLDDEFEYVRHYASDYYTNYYEADSDELNYMHSVLTQDNINLLVDIAKKIGLRGDIYNDFRENEGAINKFLSKYDLDVISDLYIEYLSDAMNTSARNAAKELMDQLPFDLNNRDEVSFDIDAMLEYYVENQLTANTFDELLDEIKQKLPYFSYDTIMESMYSDVDYDDLNKNIKEKLGDIISDIDNDEDNHFYQTAKLIKSTTNYLEKIGFEILDDSDDIAQLKAKNGTITIKNVYLSDVDDDENSTIMVKATIGDKSINVPLTSLRNYIDQHEFQNYLNEEIRRVKKLLEKNL